MTNKIDFDRFAQAIAEENPDIIGLCEVRGRGLFPGYREQIRILSKKLQMNGVFGKALKFYGFNPYGVGLLSKFPFEFKNVTKIPMPETKMFDGLYEQRAILSASVQVDCCDEPVNVFVSHFGLNPDEHKLCVETAISILPDRRTIFMGDFNMMPDNKILRPLLDKFYSCESATPTFPADSPVSKLDYILTSKDLSCVETYVPEVIISDHQPIVAVVEI